MMTGPGRAGKSGTVRSLLGKPFNPNLESTIGADASQTCSVDRNENVVNWKEIVDKKGGEFGDHVARAVVARLEHKGSLFNQTASNNVAPTTPPVLYLQSQRTRRETTTSSISG
jgi:hypothetical protein